jgi:hypothetical protein
MVASMIHVNAFVLTFVLLAEEAKKLEICEIENVYVFM